MTLYSLTGLERAMMRLINEDRFYAEVLMQLERKADPKLPMGSAAVGINPRPTLYYHPDVFEINDVETAKNILKHEVGHLILEHLTRFTKMTPKHNIAVDLAVNSLIPGFQTIRVSTPEGIKEVKLATVANMKAQIPALIEGQTAEWYLKMIDEQIAKDKDPGEPEGGDDHSKWGDGKGEPGSELDEHQVKGLLQNAVERTQNAGGVVPDGVRDLVKRLLAGRNDWQRLLQRFPQDAEVAFTEDTRRRRNRRYGLQYPGSRKVRKVKIVVGIDVSGSVFGPLLERFFSEVDKIAQFATVEAAFFDHKVQKVIAWEEFRKLKQIPGGGGTMFQPMLDEAAKRKADGLIMLTDGFNFDQTTKPKYPVLWAVPEQFNYTPQFGTLVKIADPK